MSPARVVVALVCALLLPGCIAMRLSEKREQVKAFEGKDIRLAMAEFGPPTDIMPAGGTDRFVRWHRVGPTVALANASGGRGYASGVAASETRTCTWWFLVAEDGRILKSQAEGRGC